MRLRRLTASASYLVVALAVMLGCGGSEPEVELNEELRAELVEMFEIDQAERSGELATDSDAAHTRRLAEIIDEYGWPTQSLVGEDGAMAAWLIAQHSDQDVEFQEQALELMREAVEDGEADSTELAYLVDRVAVNRGEPQTYGTQFGGCEAGEPVALPIADEEGVDDRRAEAGLQPLSDYLAEFAEICAAEEAEER